MNLYEPMNRPKTPLFMHVFKCSGSSGVSSNFLKLFVLYIFKIQNDTILIPNTIKENIFIPNR